MDREGETSMHRKAKITLRTTLALVLAIHIVPYLWPLLTSLKTQSQIFDLQILPSTLFWGNYGAVLSESGFLRSIYNSLLVGAFTVLFCVAIGVPAAYAFARIKFRFRDTLFMLVLFITIFPGIFIISPLFNFLRSIGAIDTPYALIIPYVAYFTPLVIWILTGYFKTIHSSIEEMAINDGCNLAQIILRIILPLSVPGLITVSIIAFTLSWNEFMFALIFTSSDNAITVPVEISRFQGVYSLNWGQVTAAAIVATLPIVLISTFLQRYVISGLTAGAIKE